MLYNLLLGDYIYLYEGLYRVYQEDLSYLGTEFLILNFTDIRSSKVSV
jgi:hypothetical protein